MKKILGITPALFRRVFHLCAPIFLVYYLVPDDLWGIGVSKRFTLLMILLVVLIIEAVRILRKKIFFGLRDYEGKQISAFAWAGVGITLAFLFFPKIFVVPIIFGMAWIDPLIGELKKREGKSLYPFLPAICYAVIFFFFVSFLSDLSILIILFLTVVGTVSALLAEYPHIKYLDDDFLMIIVPLVILTLFHNLIETVL